MIKFFRKIRKNLLNEGKTSKYFKYAIGEIILVVIGILIALQINNWNEDKIDRRIEKTIMRNINVEFKNNLFKIKTSIKNYKETEQSIRLLMSYMKFSSEQLSQINVDSLIENSIDTYDFRPTQNALTEIISSGNLKLITNDSLKNMLLEWSAELNEKEEAWQTVDYFNQNKLVPYLTENASMRNIDRYGLMKWEEKSKFEVPMDLLFTDIEFENQLDNLGWAVVNYNIALTRLENIIEQIIILTDD